MQKVIKTVYTNLCDLKLAIDGTIVMSQYLRDSLDAMYDARIPERWQKVKSKINKLCCFLRNVSWFATEQLIFKLNTISRKSYTIKLTLTIYLVLVIANIVTFM